MGSPRPRNYKVETTARSGALFSAERIPQRFKVRGRFRHYLNPRHGDVFTGGWAMAVRTQCVLEPMNFGIDRRKALQLDAIDDLRICSGFFSTGK